MNKHELASKIWRSANDMRSKIEANEYKDYILGFIFYKFLCGKVEDLLVSYDVPREDFADYLTESDDAAVTLVQNKLGFFISHEHLYSTWMSGGGRNFDVARVRDALAAFSRNVTRHEVFDGIFDTLQTGLSKLGDTAAAQTRSIRKLLATIDDIPTDGKQGYDVLGFIYEYLIANFAANAGKKAGEFYTPHEVSELMSQIIAAHLGERSEIQIYDPTSGSGSLLLNIGQAMKPHMDNAAGIKYYAQELKSNTYNLTRMNLLMRGVEPYNIVTRNGDSLEQDWPIFDEDDPAGTYRTLYVDAVVSNPPYSQNWDPSHKENDPRFSRFGLAPDSKADYAFVLHDLYHLKPDGIMTIVLPHGVLFRGHSEATIRRQLVEQNHVDAIIGLPPNIFYGTGIPVIIMVLKQRRDNDDTLFIDASRGFIKSGNKNQLRARDIRRIADAVANRVNIDRFARVVSRDEIRANDYNLNIPRYVSAAEPTESVDLFATVRGGIPASELNEFAEAWTALPGLRDDLFTLDNAGYAHLVDDPQAVLDTHSSVTRFNARVTNALAGMDMWLNDKLVRSRAGARLATTADEITHDLFERFASVPLLDVYEAYQIVHDQWQIVRADLEMIQTEGDAAIRAVEPRLVMKKRQKTKETYEVADGWTGRILPFDLVQDMLLGEQRARVDTCADRQTRAERQLAELIEGLSDDQKTELAEVMNDDATAFAKATLSRSVKMLRKTGEDYPEDSSEGIQIAALRLINETTAAKKDLTAGRAELDAATIDALRNLSDVDVERLLVAKWITPMIARLADLPRQRLRDLLTNIRALADKYRNPVVEVAEQTTQIQRELTGMLDSLVGSPTDMEALRALKAVLEG
ncbi:type I restriction-modification system subunit M [Nanchangia anserum]|uniref:site-specific DNA-methyltransferase (adenine-specific) n=1 Tax=Nanchangia anserum TaxID=2692125 RepID=A0A8I0GDC6_9ACTO|nr:type I restriction-modification system subunit M [Nanchangia anserum]MBD3690181.1 type I restriction-modification system subunit M [Nanchangia anserum]QOX82364.1 type I restriction-modification system subunit M [Nanchangia anserum]